MYSSPPPRTFPAAEGCAGRVFWATVHSVVGACVKIGGGGAMSGSSGSGTYSERPSALRVLVP